MYVMRGNRVFIRMTREFTTSEIMVRWGRCTRSLPHFSRYTLTLQFMGGIYARKSLTRKAQTRQYLTWAAEPDSLRRLHEVAKDLM